MEIQSLSLGLMFIIGLILSLGGLASYTSRTNAPNPGGLVGMWIAVIVFLFFGVPSIQALGLSQFITQLESVIPFGLSFIGAIISYLLVGIVYALTVEYGIVRTIMIERPRIKKFADDVNKMLDGDITSFIVGNNPVGSSHELAPLESIRGRVTFRQYLAGNSMVETLPEAIRNKIEYTANTRLCDRRIYDYMINVPKVDTTTGALSVELSGVNLTALMVTVAPAWPLYGVTFIVGDMLEQVCKVIARWSRRLAQKYASLVFADLLK